MRESQRALSDFEPVWQAVAGRLPAATSPVYRAGMVGEIVRGAGRPLLASDLTHLLIPGLAALGIQARLTVLSGKETEQKHCEQPEGVCLLFGFASPLLFSPPEEINDATPLPGDTDPQITAQALLSEETQDDRSKRQNASDLPDNTALLRSHFSHLLTLTRAASKPLRRESFQAVLQRWLGSYAAYPERVPREADIDDSAGTLAAAFLSESIGTRRDFVANRLRYAARCFEAAQIESAYRWLLEAGITFWQLPAATAEALLTAPERPLSDTLRQELIYLARAGTLPLKTLAARRLTHERHHPDASKTLHQLCFDLDPWVRAASRPASP